MPPADAFARSSRVAFNKDKLNSQSGLDFGNKTGLFCGRYFLNYTSLHCPCPLVASLMAIPSSQEYTSFYTALMSFG